MSLPKLPPELECQIFETAARDYRDHLQSTQVINLSLVARRVHFWVEPVFLEVIALLDKGHAEKFLKLVDMKPEGFFANVVRALCLPYHVDAKNASRILSICTGVRMLACWVDSLDAPDLPLLISACISRLPLTRLEIEVEHFLDIPLDTSTWLSSLTHLDLTFWEDVEDSAPQILSALGQLPGLSHVAMASGDLALARALCSKYPNLQVVRIGSGEDFTDEDPRIVLRQSDISAVEEWVQNVP
ncbi:hypothetical protein C8J57DRAFT_1275391 [Mycena rebaudengoi]|nr:hypothetical protein C8J57DRAFT_1275391 [Mycena rebaudengoi]